jgi:hypothetical protein
MRIFISLSICLFTASLGVAQVELLPSIGLVAEPLDNEPVCEIIPRNQGNPWTPIAVGDTMADFTLWDLDGNPVTLSAVLNSGKRALMVAGSYTCPIFRNHMPELNAVAAEFADGLECFVIYTVEAHPTDSPMPYSGNYQPTNPPFYQPNSYLARKQNIQAMLNGEGEGA